MSRLFVFLFGVLVGAAGVYGLARQGWLHGPAPPVPAAPPVAVAPVEAPALPPTTLRPPGVTEDSAAIASSIAAAVPSTVAAPAVASTVPTPLAAAVDTLPGAVVVPPLAGLLVPVAGIKKEQLVDTFTQSRGQGRRHDAIDIMAARGTPVLAVDDGQVAKLFTSQRGGLTVYEFDRNQTVAYYYAHLDSYAPGVVEGKQLKRGDLIGFVGSTGDASVDAPHLHFAISVLGPDKKWWQGTAINPYPLLRGLPASPASVSSGR